MHASAPSATRSAGRAHSFHPIMSTLRVIYFVQKVHPFLFGKEIQVKIIYILASMLLNGCPKGSGMVTVSKSKSRVRCTRTVTLKMPIHLVKDGWLLAASSSSTLEVRKPCGSARYIRRLLTKKHLDRL